MTPRDFAYWLQGYFEVSGNGEFTEKQTAIMKEHLHLVFALAEQKAKEETKSIISGGSGGTTASTDFGPFSIAGDVTVSC